MWRLVFVGWLFALSLFGPAAADQIDGRVLKYQHRENAPNPLAEGVAAYQHGDYATAMRLLRPLAADQGMALAQFSLGVMYANGNGVLQDYAQAAMWYRKAGDQGDDEAQGNLGAMYAKGQGVPQDYAEAANWYRKAADQGNKDAKMWLAAH